MQTVRLSKLGNLDRFRFFPNSQVFKILLKRGYFYAKNTVTGKETLLNTEAMDETLVYPVNGNDT